MSRSLRVLMAEDLEDDALLIARELRRGGYDLVIERVDSAEAMEAALTRQAWDVVIADYSMPRFDGLAALRLMQTSGLDLPFIIVSGTIGEEIAVTAMKAGAHDYVMKDNLARLVPAVERELQEAQVRAARKRAEQELEESTEKIRAMFESVTDGIVFTDLDGNIIELNEAAVHLLGYEAKDQIVGKNALEFVRGSEWTQPDESAGYDPETGRSGLLEYRIVTRQGDGFDAELSAATIQDGQGNPAGFVAILRDITDRKRAEEALRESEERFRRMADSIHDGLTIVEQGKVVYLNDRICEITGYSKQELREMSSLDFAAPEEVERLRQIMEEARQIGVLPRELEYWLVRKDGTRRCINNRYTLRGWQNSLIDRYVVTTDITERKMAEREIEERRRYLERVLSAAPDAVVTLDARHRIVEWNPGAERLFGYSREEAIGQKVDQLIAVGDEREEAVWFTQMVMGGEELAPVEIVCHRKDGSPVDVIAAGSPIVVEGKLAGAVAIYTDISERKRAERLLQTLNEAALAVEQALTPEELFAKVAQEFKKLGFSCAIFLLDAQSRLVPAFLSYGAMALKAAEKLAGVKARDYAVPVEEVTVMRRVARERQTVFADGESAVQQFLPRPLQRFAGGLIKVLRVGKLISAPLIVEDEVIGLLTVESHDLVEEDAPAITAFAHQVAAALRKAHLMQDLEKSLEELKRTQAQFLQAQKMEAVGRLAGGVAHDFNNALTIIQLSTQLLRRQLRAEDPLWEYVQQIEEASDRASQLTKQLLSFSRREIIQPRMIDLNSVVSDLGQMLQRIIGEDIRLATYLADGLWPVYLDPTQLDQVIVNLAVNARDAMPHGGSLAIETANVVLDEVYAARHMEVEPGEYVMLSISDTGLGMDDEVLAHLFEPFFTTKERGKGTGLGLATVYGIVKQNDGYIWVYSELGQGTSFKIYLPRALRTNFEPTPDADPVGTIQGTEVVLVVEDDRTVRRMAQEILVRHGYRVLTAGDGLEAIEVSHGHNGPIHLLLTDVILPQMNGRDLAGQVRSIKPGLRVLYMSGYSVNVISEHGILAEGEVFLSKPFTMETLTQKVRMVLDA